MNFPSWLLEATGGGVLIALIAVPHVFISHLAVGGGIFIWLLDRKAFKTGDTLINDFLRKHNWVFLLTTMIFGGVSGVGIWFIIALVQPAATSSLIHNFVFGWAIEWVFFLGEVVALIVYHYYFDRLERKARLNVAFLYALFAWLSLFIINGILTFMLTPGKWIETHNFWHGFLNPGYFAALFFRTFAAILMAGAFAYIVGAFNKDDAIHDRFTRIGARWSLVGLVGMVPTGFWYYYTTPAATRAISFGMNPQLGPWVTTMLVATAILVVFSLIGVMKLPRGMRMGLAVLTALAAFAWIGGFEYTREYARKPWVIYDTMYSNSFLAGDDEVYAQSGVLSSAKWVQNHAVTKENELAAGRELFELECLACHTVGGRSDVADLTAAYPWMGVKSLLTGQGKARGYMPPFIGNEVEMDALASYITAGLHKKPIVREVEPSGRAGEIYDEPLPPKPDDYVLLSWMQVGGMRCVSDADAYFTIMPPTTIFDAQLIKRGDPPEVITEGVTVTYEAPEQHKHPSRHSKFWDHITSLMGTDTYKDMNPKSDEAMSGELKLVEGTTWFRAGKIPTVPYRDDGGYDPYPVFTIRALDADGNLLAETQAVGSTTTEMACKNCHGGDWRDPNLAGMSDQTARNILAAHDRLSGTNLLAEAEAGNPRRCQNSACHGDPAPGIPDNPEVLSMSAAMHGWHANYMFAEGMDACTMCHPNDSRGFTRCFRGLHADVGFGCADCHGEIQDHAIALLKAEADKPAAGVLLANLEPVTAASVDEINPRKPWGQEPDCMGCHADYQPPDDFASFNNWTEPGQVYKNRTDDSGSLRCVACHGTPHVVYPAVNAFAGEVIDNIQPLQYQDEPRVIATGGRCTVCHTVMPEFELHHDNSLRR